MISFIDSLRSCSRNGANKSAITFRASSLLIDCQVADGDASQHRSLPLQLNRVGSLSPRESERKATFRCLPSRAWNNSLARLA